MHRAACRDFLTSGRPNAAAEPKTTASTAEAEFEDCEEGKRLALALGNRGPARFGPDGKLAPEILDAWWEHGFYVFEGVVEAQELSELRNEFEEFLDRRP